VQAVVYGHENHEVELHGVLVYKALGLSYVVLTLGCGQRPCPARQHCNVCQTNREKTRCGIASYSARSHYSIHHTPFDTVGLLCLYVKLEGTR